MQTRNQKSEHEQRIQTSHSFRRRDQSVSHRRSGNARALRYSSRYSAGEYVSIAGPSGCGKSTLLSILGLLDTPSGGSYSLKGSEVANLSFPERARIRNREIGFIFQSFNLIGDLTVFENVELPLTYRGMSAGDRKARSRRHWSVSGWDIAPNICRVSSGWSAATGRGGARACW